jgi:hypothetical protein
MVQDVPNDAGGSLMISWQPSMDAAQCSAYELQRSEDGISFETIGMVPVGTTNYMDRRATSGVAYQYRVVAIGHDGATAESVISDPCASRGQWFHAGKLNILIGFIIYAIILLYFIYQTRMGKQMYIRPIAGLEALDEAVGRATEMGKPILYVPGLSTIADIATIASLNILSRVAKKTAEYNTTLLVPNRDPVVFTVAQEIVKQAYTDAGRPDAYKPDNVYFITGNQFAYVGAVCGTMVREKPATNLFLGYFWAESLLLAETGSSTGAIQIAGTDSVFQLPFFITACDYTLIGEELYAASAYLSRDPLLLSTLKGQDWGKMLILAILIIASVLILIGLNQVYTLFSV